MLRQERRSARRRSYVGPVYLRFGRLAVPVFNDPETYHFELGKGITLRDGKDVTVVATGLMVAEALEAAETAGRQRASMHGSSTSTPSSRWMRS